MFVGRLFELLRGGCGAVALASSSVAPGDSQVDVASGSLQDVDGLLVTDLRVERLTVYRQNAVTC